MFGKLMKYNLKEVGIVMLPMYAALLVLGTAAGLAMRYSIMRGAGEIIASTVPGVITIILFLVFGVMGLATVVVTLIMILRNFRDNLLGSRGYLMNTLPVTTAEQVLSKVLNGVLFILFGGAASGLSGLLFLLVYLRRRDWAELGESFREAFGDKMSPTLVVLQIVVLLLFWAVQVVAKLYISLSLGNLWRDHRSLGANLAFVGITELQNLLGNGLTRLTSDASLGYSVMGGAIRFIFGAGDGPAALFSAKQMGISIGQNLAYIILFAASTIWILRHKLDLQ